jgi:hypothetical protein
MHTIIMSIHTWKDAIGVTQVDMGYTATIDAKCAVLMLVTNLLRKKDAIRRVVLQIPILTSIVI